MPPFAALPLRWLMEKRASCPLNKFVTLFAKRPAQAVIIRTVRLCVLKTLNLGGGSCYDQQTLDAIAAVATETGCASHIDGARIFNAAVATQVSMWPECVKPTTRFRSASQRDWGRPWALSSSDHQRSSSGHRWRKMFGGGWRQAGMLAAACHHALDHHAERLAEDHARAKTMAEGLDALPGFSVDLATVQTNMSHAATDRPATEVVSELSRMASMPLTPAHIPSASWFICTSPMRTSSVCWPFARACKPYLVYIHSTNETRMQQSCRS